MKLTIMLFLSLPRFWVQVFFLALCFQTASICVIPLG